MKNENNFIFSPYISESTREELQEVFYFNTNQERYRSKIINAITLYGKPIIVIENHLITIQLNKPNLQQQTLFIIDKENANRLIGVLIYVKEINIINIVHLSFYNQDKYLKNQESFSIFNLTIKKFAIMLKNIKNIQYIKFQYNSMIISLDNINTLL
jgi:hypothetical protein